MAVDDQSPRDDRPDAREPQDDPFLERLFETMCRYIFVLPDETFVDWARRWTHALAYMAELKPRTEREWLLASDVAMKHLFAQHSLALGRAKGIRKKQRLEHGNDFIARAKILHAAQLRYDLLRSSPSA